MNGLRYPEMINDFSWPKLDVIVILHDICNVREVEMIEFCMVPTMFQKLRWYNFTRYLQCSRNRNGIILHGIHNAREVEMVEFCMVSTILGKYRW